MHISAASYKFYVTTTDESFERMNQALQLAFIFENDLLRKPESSFGPISIQSLLDQYGVSRGVAHEAIRILQHRSIIETKRGPHGGLQIITQSDANLKYSIAQFLLSQNFTPDCCNQAREALLSVMSCLSPDNPGRNLLTLMLDLLDQLLDEAQENFIPQLSSNAHLQANRIAQKILRGALSTTKQQSLLRVGHENELCEVHEVSKPVIRQAIRILEAQTLVEARRGRGQGLYFVKPQPGPISRLLAFWLLGRKATLAQIFEIEHPLRVAVAMLAMRNDISAPAYQQLMTLQETMERGCRIQLVDIIHMEKQVSWLADNALLDLLLRSMTVFKISRGHYQEHVQDNTQSFASLNKQFLHGLFNHKDSQIQDLCQQKNHFLMHTDIEARDALPGEIRLVV